MHQSTDRAAPGLFKIALAWAVIGCALFLGTYSACNWLAARRAGVPHLYFVWELRLPFVPGMIVPYLSADVFVFFSFFLCTSRGELRRHGLRLGAAIAIASIFFLLFPLRIAFTRPAALGGVNGFLFDVLGVFDRPFNLVPSLHLAMLVLLWVIYRRHTRDLGRIAVEFWFILIGLSTVLTRQHQVIDVVTGLALGALCLYLVPDDERQPSARNRHVPIGIAYAGGAIACLIGAWWFAPLGLLLIWPAVSLGIVSAAYCGLGTTVFRKRDGTVPWRAKLLLGPCLAGTWIWMKARRGRDDVPGRLAANVLIGARPRPGEAQRLVSEGVTAVLDLTAELSEPNPLRFGITYRNIPVLDLAVPTREQLEEAVGFICEQSAHGTVYVHCALGRWRTACVACAWLLASGSARTAQDAIEQTRAVRPSARRKVGGLAVVRSFER